VPVPFRPSPGPVSRRCVIGVGLVGLGTVAGCSHDSSPTPPGRTQPTTVTPDVRTATAALAAVRAVLVALDETARRYPATRPALSGLRAMHTAHERSLVGAVPRGATATRTTSRPVPGNRAAALTQLRASETRLHATLQALAVRAQSGDFARLLASMSAAVSTHLAVLATTAPAGSG
jgi:hypothetical protein